MANSQNNIINNNDSIAKMEKTNYRFDIGQSLDYLLATGFHYKYHKQIYFGFSLYKPKWGYIPEISYFFSKFSYLVDTTYFGRKIEEKDNFISLRTNKEFKIKLTKFRLFLGIALGYYKYYSLSPGDPIFDEKSIYSFTFFPILGGRLILWKNISFFANVQSGIWISHSTERLFLNGSVFQSEIKKGISFYSPNPINFGISLNIN